VTTETLALTAFLLARIAEDEAAARDSEWLAFEYGVDSAGRAAFSARVLAGCEAKRSIVALHTEDVLVYHDGSGGVGCLECDDDRDYGFSPNGHCPTLLALAAIWSDHEDWQAAWR
jgi:hypothetical protein